MKQVFGDRLPGGGAVLSSRCVISPRLEQRAHSRLILAASRSWLDMPSEPYPNGRVRCASVRQHLLPDPMYSHNDGMHMLASGERTESYGRGK